MFWNTLKMELDRAVRPGKMCMAAAAIVVLLLISDGEMLHSFLVYGDLSLYGSVTQIFSIFAMDTFKCVFVIILAGLYTGSFCRDDNNYYLRMILTRTDVTVFTQCRFLANLCVVVLVSVFSLYLYVGVTYLLGMPLLSGNGAQSLFYRELAEKYPLLYVGMNGIVFGLTAAASCSIGLLYSAYKTNSFVCIGASGLIFYMAMSYIPPGTPFNVSEIVGMHAIFHVDASKLLMFLWSVTYMLAVIGICGFLFWRRMRWRVENGQI